jgi:hypothetical protein
MPCYVFDVRRLDDLCLEDNPAGVELRDDVAAREFALKVMLGLVQSQNDDWAGRWRSSKASERSGGSHSRR